MLIGRAKINLKVKLNAQHKTESKSNCGVHLEL